MCWVHISFVVREPPSELGSFPCVYGRGDDVKSVRMGEWFPLTFVYMEQCLLNNLPWVSGFVIRSRSGDRRYEFGPSLRRGIGPVCVTVAVELDFL